MQVDENVVGLTHEGKKSNLLSTRIPLHMPKIQPRALLTYFIYLIQFAKIEELATCYGNLISRLFKHHKESVVYLDSCESKYSKWSCEPYAEGIYKSIWSIVATALHYICVIMLIKH